jgi:hypothetical protein
MPTLDYEKILWEYLIDLFRKFTDEFGFTGEIIKF